MRVTLLGTGCPVAHLHRYGPAQLVEAGGARVLVDCGSGVTQRLLGAGTRGADLDAVLITHTHSDHVVDFFQLVISSWHQGRTRPQRVIGPAGTRAFVTAQLDAWRFDLDRRIRHECRPSTAALDVEVEEVADGDRVTVGGLEATVVEVDHRPVVPALGFVFRADGRSAALSGDTRYCPALITAARGVDLLVHEVFIHREMKPIKGVRTTETVQAVAGYHTASGEVGRVAAEAGAGALALTHFVPPDFDPDPLTAEVRLAYPGPLVLGRDLTAIDLAEGTVTAPGAEPRALADLAAAPAAG